MEVAIPSITIYLKVDRHHTKNKWKVNFRGFISQNQATSIRLRNKKKNTIGTRQSIQWTPGSQIYLSNKNKTSIQWTPGSQIDRSNKNKTSIQWTPGSQIDRSNQKVIFSKK